ncbi:MAG: hypothetical protein [Microvirus sp.]|nr:MAG: hypothetical protein [Microvirus sp.]
MAEGKSAVVVTLSLDNLQKAWVKKSVETMRAVLVRSRGREVPGSEIDQLRGREVQALDAILALL